MKIRIRRELVYEVVIDVPTDDERQALERAMRADVEGPLDGGVLVSVNRAASLKVP